jgi:hypothetical protein
MTESHFRLTRKLTVGVRHGYCAAVHRRIFYHLTNCTTYALLRLMDITRFFTTENTEKKLRGLFCEFSYLLESAKTESLVGLEKFVVAKPQDV